jgi:hypothetical protein
VGRIREVYKISGLKIGISIGYGIFCAFFAAISAVPSASASRRNAPIAMQAKRETDDAKTRYATRKQAVAWVFGIIKSVMDLPPLPTPQCRQR